MVRRWCRSHMSVAWLALLVASAPLFAAERAVIVPVEIVEGNNIAQVDAGDARLRVHIDTGGYQSIGVTTEALARMSVRFGAETVTRSDGSGAKFEDRTFVIPTLTLGNHTFRDVPGYERKQAATGNFGGPAPFDAIIGREFLAPFVVVVDYPKKRIELHPPANGRRVCGRSTATLRTTPDGFWSSRVETDHGSFEMVWDTGARGASFLQERFVAARGLPLKDDAYLSQRFRFGRRDLGPIELVPLALDGFPSVDGLIGISVFAKHRVCFDARRGIVSVR